LFILGGSAATRVNGKIMNRSYNFSPEGIEIAVYDKMNLFAVDLFNVVSHLMVTT
jgi:predicted amidohydrolase